MERVEFALCGSSLRPFPPQSDAGTDAVLEDELDSSGLEGDADGVDGALSSISPEEVAACDRLLARLRRFRELPPRAPSEKERKAVDSIIAILDRLARGVGSSTARARGGRSRPFACWNCRRRSGILAWTRLRTGLWAGRVTPCLRPKLKSYASPLSCFWLEQASARASPASFTACSPTNPPAQIWRT